MFHCLPANISMARVIPLADARTALPLAAAAPRVAPSGLLADTRGRHLRDLRISVTDRCNFRCVYCMPKDVFGHDYPFLPHAELLTFEEITRLARIFKAHGIEKIRLTGGEPLLRKNLERLIAMLADIGGLDLTLTTNGAALTAKARELKAAGLNRITVSLDALDDGVFRAMNNVDFPVVRVLEGIDAAAEAGLAPVKINMVVKRGVNEHEILPMARRFKGSGHVLRFIEYMDVGHTNGWRMDDVVSSAEVIRTIGRELPLEPIGANYAGEVAERWRYRRRRRRDRRDLVSDAGVLSQLHARAARHRRQALYLPVRDDRLRSARAAARRKLRHGDRQLCRGDLAAARGPLFRDSIGEYRRSAEDRDELHRRVSGRLRLVSSPRANEFAPTTRHRPDPCTSKH